MPLSLPRPACLAAPLRLLPAPVLNAMAACLATQVLRQALADGDLEELEGKVVAVSLRRPTLTLRVTVRGHAVRPAGAGPAVVTIGAEMEDLLLVAAQLSDPDTLFFRRRLQLSGDTALGLTVKNALDSASFESLPPGSVPLLRQLAEQVPPTPDR
ncbi:ubiquinone anaerobic biosynthesis accessory factor UbiT [Arhodomonas sp. AD133]|uniref:ubiquinone anaerobic biosynthesis accessory factor UbiT n=1 Tax=Arhodomonas sp. AD133 TaxID=3415009 RepID=UPI003EC10378